jgi:3-deoxy-7-phosphoheptulonate synthase
MTVSVSKPASAAWSGAPALPPTRAQAAASGAAGTTPVRVVDAVTVGTREVVVIAGPCSVEGRGMLHDTAQAVRRVGARMLRGGAYKPRTSPHSFQGLGAEALELLAEVRHATGLPVVSEVVDPRHVEQMTAAVDVLQVGARNMQNFALLAEVGRARVPVLLKRGLSATIRELLLAAEHVRVGGNERVILCERGIRTFEPSTRNTLDIAAVPVLKSETDLPVVVDPSHAGGRAALVTPLALAAVAAGADGLLIEVHPTPATALSDGEQSLDFAAFGELMRRLAPVAAAVGRTLCAPLADEPPVGAVAPTQQRVPARPDGARVRSARTA